MDKSKHKAAMDALNDLILSELQSEDRQRFSSVKRLSILAQQLLLANTDEMTPEDGDDYDYDDGLIVGGPMRQHRRARLMVGGGDQAQIVREVLAALNPMLQANAEGAADAHRKALADELNSLISTRMLLGKLEETSPIAVRINEILKEMKGDEDGLSLVSAVDVRRHQIGTYLGELNPDCGDRPFADGEGCDPRSDEARFEAATREEMARDGNAQLGLFGGAELAPERTDLESARRSPEEPEAAPEAGLGGALHEREDRAGDRGDAADDRLGGFVFRDHYEADED